jgi:hypothetical protein
LLGVVDDVAGGAEAELIGLGEDVEGGGRRERTFTAGFIGGACVNGRGTCEDVLRAWTNMGTSRVVSLLEVVSCVG